MHDLANAAQRALGALEMFYECEAFVPTDKKLSDDELKQEKERREAVYLVVEDAIVQLRRSLRNYRIYSEKNERTS